MVLLGAAFTLCFFWTLIFAIVGIPIWYLGWRKARGWLDALETGMPTVGEIVDCKLDHSQQVNNQHPWLIRFTFEQHNGETAEGSVEAWDDVNSRRKAGDRLWIVYVQGRPEAHAIWPPVY